MLNITTTTSRPLSLVSPPGASEGLCPVCLDAFDTRLPTVTPSECGHRAHAACLERWKIKCVKMTCPVCRTELTGDLVNDEMTNPVVTPGGMPLSLGDFSSALFQAGRTYGVRRADALLASASLSIGERRVCFAVVDRVMVRARMRLSIMPWHEYNRSGTSLVSLSITRYLLSLGVKLLRGFSSCGECFKLNRVCWRVCTRLL